MRWKHCDICFQLSSVPSLSCVQGPATPWTAACHASLSITNSWSLHKPMSIESVMPSNHLILCPPLLLLLSLFLSIRVFSNESGLHIRWPKYWSLSSSINPSNEYSRLISFRIDWLYFLAVQVTLKSLLQHHSPKAQLFSAQSSLWSNSYTHTWLLEKPQSGYWPGLDASDRVGSPHPVHPPLPTAVCQKYVFDFASPLHWELHEGKSWHLYYFLVYSQHLE